MPSAHRKRSPGLTNARGFSAAAFSGIIGLPEQGRGPRLYDGGLAAFSRDVRRGYEYFWSRRPHVHRPDTGSFLPDIRHRATPTAGFAP